MIYFSSIGLWGQDLFYKVYDLRAGLRSNVVYDLEVDSLGYLYLGTDCGIYQFNGRDFVEIVVERSKATTFTDLEFDEGGRLWVRNFSNEIFCLEKDTLRHATQYFGANTSTMSISRLIHFRNHIYINDGLSVYSLDLETMKVDTLAREEEYRENLVREDFLPGLLWDFCVDSTNRLFMKSEYSFWMKGLGEPMREIGLDLPQNILWAGGKFSLDEGRVFYTPFVQNAMLVYEWDSLGRSRQTGTDKGPSVKLLQTFRAASGRPWFCSTQGLYEFEEGLGPRMLLPSNFQTTKVIQDFEGGYWVGTILQGLVYIPSLRMRQTGLGNSIFTILTRKQAGDMTILAGSNLGSVAELDSNGRAVFEYRSPRQDDIQFIHYDSVRRRIYHTQGYHEEGRSEIAVFSPLSKGLLSLDDQHFVVGGWANSYIVHKDLDKPVALPQSYLNKVEPIDLISNGRRYEKYAWFLRRHRVRAVWDGGENDLFFVASIDGLFCFDRNNALRPESILSPFGMPMYVTALAGKGDTLWVATFQNGVYGITQKEKKVFAHYTMESGLSDKHCKRLAIDKNKLWVVTNSGVDLIDINSNIVENISQKYSFDGNFINDVMLTEKYVWLCSNQWLLRLDNQMNAPFPEPRLVVKTLTYDNKKYPHHSPVEMDFGNSGGDLTLTFESISFRNQQALFFEYRINGGDWSLIPTEQKYLSIENIAPGNYTLELRIKTHLQKPSSQYKLRFFVSPPIWKRWEGIAVIAIITIAILIGIANTYINRTIAEQKLQQALSQSQLVSLRARMSPHFFHNVLNSVQSALKENKTVESIKLLEKFSLLMRVVLNISEQDLTPLHEELESAIIYLDIESLRLAPNLCLYIKTDIPKELARKPLYVPSMIVQPIAENAVKHGLAHTNTIQHIALVTTVENDHLTVTVTDNGIGRNAAAITNRRRRSSKVTDPNNKNISFTSFATNAIVERLKLINTRYNTNIYITITDLYNKIKHPIGTEVKIFIPVDFILQSSKFNKL